MGDEKISPGDAEELAACFTAHARDLFGYACVLARGDRALAEDLVQAAFEAAGRAWWTLRCLADDQRRGWLRTTLANIAVSGFRREAAFRDRLPRIEARYRTSPADTAAQAFSSIALERCWQIIKDMPERQHAVAALRWQQDMKEGEIAAALGMAEKTVSAHLHRARRKLAARFGTGYDVAGGLDRCRAWLREHTAGDQAIQVRMPMTLGASPGVTGAAAAVAYPGGLMLAGEPSREAAATRGQIPGAGADRDADRALTALYSLHYRSLVKLAALLVADTADAEEVVQDAFIAVHTAWRKLQDTDRALSYLRQSVVNRSRSVLRHRAAVGKIASKPAPDMPAAEQGTIIQLERSALVSALRALPPRQREALVLRYYAGLSEAQIASAMGISTGAAKSHTAQAVASLRAALEGANE